MISKLPRSIWLKTILKGNSSLKKAMNSLELSHAQIILVINEKKQLIGTITDGDIRRSILKNISLETKINKIMNFNPSFLNENMPREYAFNFMKQNQLKNIPFVNDNRVIRGLYMLGNYVDENQKNSIKKIINSFVIMAGGRGERMKPLTNNKPKALLKLNNRPMIEHIITKAKTEGFSNFTISINYLGKQIKNYLGDGSRLGVNISYLEEKKFLGTAGSLQFLKLSGNPIIVCNCDIITDISFKSILEFHKKKRSHATMAMRVYEYKNPYGVLETRGYKIKKIIEKQTLIHKVNAGIYVLNEKVIKLIRKNQYIDMTKLFEKIEKKFVYPTFEDWDDVGNIKRYEEINSEKK